VVCESVVINEYIDDAFPAPALKPADAKGRARMRGMTKFIDAAIFPSTGIVSLSIAFHYQYSPEAQELRAKVQPGWREQFSQVQKGTENSAFPAAIKRLDKMLADMEKALTDSGGPWLLGKDLSLADIGYAPYVTRLDHLKFLRHMIAKRPKTAPWYAALQARKPYQDALAKWFNPKYLPLMDEKGTEAWPKVQALLAA
jgi:glutathione S-transferase